MTTLLLVRRFLAAILLFGMAGTVIELLLMEHYEDSIQLIPLGLLSLGVVTIAWHVVVPSRASLRAVQLVMGLSLAAGLAGVYFHLQADLQFQREFNPALHGRALLWQALQSKVPPALAPGVLVQFGLIGLAYTYGQRGDLR